MNCQTRLFIPWQAPGPIAVKLMLADKVFEIEFLAHFNAVFVQWVKDAPCSICWRVVVTVHYRIIILIRRMNSTLLILIVLISISVELICRWSKTNSWFIAIFIPQSMKLVLKHSFLLLSLGFLAHINNSMLGCVTFNLSFVLMTLVVLVVYVNICVLLICVLDFGILIIAV